MCYAMRPEKRWKRALPYRLRQEKYWKRVNAEQFFQEFMEYNFSRRASRFTALRLNESGDFWTQDCIQKADKIAGYLKIMGIDTYCYTARKDLNFSRVKFLIVMGSGFTKRGIRGTFKMIENIKDKPSWFGLCPMNCRNCTRCLNGQDTVVMKH